MLELEVIPEHGLVSDQIEFLLGKKKIYIHFRPLEDLQKFLQW